jgi:drug/metabolite transporter (DMT)-like permease
MKDVSADVAAFGGMFFGAIVMLAYIIASGKVATLAVLDGQQFIWIAVTAVLLLGYVTSYYAGLKYATASVVASVLVLGSVITSLLYVILDARRYSLEQVAGMVLIGAAVFILSRASGLTWHKRSLPAVTE